MATKGFVISRLPGFNPIAGLVFVGLYLPIIILVVYSFNAGRSVAGWEGFSLHWYTVAWENDAVKAATVRSLYLAASAIIAGSAPAICTEIGSTSPVWSARRRVFSLP